MDVAEAGGEIARNARMELEAKTGKAVISPLNARQALRSIHLRKKKTQKNNPKK